MPASDEPVLDDTTPLMPPLDVAAEIVAGNITLAWAGDAGAVEYNVYYGTSSRVYNNPIPVRGTEYVFPGLNTGVQYYFAVTGIDSAGNESGYSYPEVAARISGGEFKTEDLHPDGVVSAGWSVRGASGNHAAIDESYDAATRDDRIRSLYGDHTDRYTISDSTSMGAKDTVSRIEVLVYGYRTGSGLDYPGDVNVRLNLGGRWISSSQGPQQLPYSVSPYTEAAWTTYTFTGSWSRDLINAAMLELYGSSNRSSNFDVVGAVVVRLF